MDTKRRPYHHPDLRNALMKAARAALDRDGHQKLSLRALAAQLEVSATAPQAHFANKQALFVALATEGFEELRLRLERCEADAQEDAVDAFSALGGAYIAFAADRPGAFRLMFGQDLDLDSDDRLSDAAVAAYDVLRKTVRARCRPGATEHDIGKTALIAWSVVHGLSHVVIDQKLSHKIGTELSRTEIERAAAEFVARTL